MRSLFLSSFAPLIIAMLTSCYGRLEDPAAESLPFRKSELGLTAGKKTVVGFSALWCKPCKKEVTVLNEAQTEFGDRVDFLVFLVEGAEKGQLPSDPDRHDLSGPSGETPTFATGIDQQWAYYRHLRPGQERSLPFLVFADEDGHVVHSEVGAVSYDQLKVGLNGLVSGIEAPKKDSPKDTTRITVHAWLESEHLTQASDQYQWLQEAFSTESASLAIPKSTLDFMNGLLSFIDPKTGSPYISSAFWTSSSGCQLEVFFAADGTTLGSQGHCS